MSVTFSIDSVGTGKYQFTCYGDSGPANFGPFDDRATAQSKAEAHTATCADCDAYRPYVNEIHDVERDMNVSNANAAMLLRTLGIEADWCGAMPADEFLGFVLVALGTPIDDSGVRSSTYQAVGADGAPAGPTIVDCGLPAGYITDRLSTLADMATEAQRLGRQIVWG